MVFFMPKVNATVNYLEASGCKSTLFDGRLSKIECNVKFRVSQTDSKYNKVTLRITMPGDFKITSTSVEAGPGWKIVSQNDTTHTYTLESAQTSFEPGTYQLFKIVSQGSSESNNCDSSLKVIPEIISRSCTIYENNYYDKEGNITTKETYEKECKKHTCEVLSDGTKYGKDGRVATDIEYEKECKKHTCEVLSDGTKYGKDGRVVTDIEYEKECKKHTCEVLSDGTKYGKNGTIVDEKTYKEECEEKTPVCEIKDEKYYDEQGKETTKEEFEKKCKKHTCEVLSDGTKYGKNGTIVDEKTYKEECEEKNPVCEYKNHQYYDNEGKATTKEEYEKKCKKHTCEIVDNKYYDKNGKEVNKSTYEASCKKITCAKVDGKYFDSKGNQVSKEEYEDSCIAIPVDNPPTGAQTPYLFLFGGVALAGTIFVETKKRNNRFYSIK